jgi:hypothetical protein
VAIQSARVSAVNESAVRIGRWHSGSASTSLHGSWRKNQFVTFSGDFLSGEFVDQI